MHEIKIVIKFNKDTRSIDLLIAKKEAQKLCRKLELSSPELLFTEKEILIHETKSTKN